MTEPKIVKHPPFQVAVGPHGFQLSVDETITAVGVSTFRVWDDEDVECLNEEDPFDHYPTADEIRALFRIIRNTRVRMQQAWPAGMHVQGGDMGLVVKQDGQSYKTAFVEAFPTGTFLRGEGTTITEAETFCWEKYQRWIGCDPHQWETRGYKNGSGFCKKCGQFGSKVFDLAEIGSVCVVCNVGSYYDVVDDKIYCEDHTPNKQAIEERKTAIERSFAGLDADPDLFSKLVGNILKRIEKEEPS